MHAYPVFLDLSDAVCLVVGAGAVGRRKLRGLLDAGAGEVRVLALSDPDAPDADGMNDADARALFARPGVRFMRRAFASDDVLGCRLVCAATNAPAVNAAVALACRAHNVLCTVADAPETGDCLIPAVIARDPIRIGLSTGGVSPALAQRIKSELDAWLAGRYEQQIALLARLRPLLLALPDLDQAGRSVVFHRLAAADMGAALDSGDRARCESLLRDALPAPLYGHIAEFLYELV
jgi:precorrin-2 dehydrogenase/sirohydrochlorin ferrochelatase